MPRSTRRNEVEPPASPALRLRAAEVASALGAAAAGAGLALTAGASLRAQAMPLLLVGLLVHGVGMSLKHRLETRAGRLARWEQALFWGCWLMLLALMLWIAIARPS